jgi:hypothetical protein
MASLLPGRILPQHIPLGRVQPNGEVIVEKEWWLLWYNLCANVLGTGGSGTSGGPPGSPGSGGGGGGGTVAGLPASALTEISAADSDIADSDAIATQAAIAWLANLFPIDPDILPISDIRNALVLAQDALLSDPIPQAPPSASVSPTGSPFTYTAPFNGQLSVTAGTVSLIQITRQAVTVATGLTTGLIPLRRGDAAVITYSGAPTLVFLPS